MRILVTGGAGFIGTNLVASLLDDPRVSQVRVLDNFATGSRENTNLFSGNRQFELIEGDIRNFDDCTAACAGMDLLTHQAALGSVPRSIADPRTSNEVNVSGTLNMFTAARDAGIRRIVYAASSSTYGDHPGLPKKEDAIGRPLSPYAVTKYVNELYARVYADLYGMEIIGLRYFNVFGPFQNPQGPYAAVIPLFVKALLENKAPKFNGDGTHSRDFTYVGNAVEANKLALFTSNPDAVNQVFNVACGVQTSLSGLFGLLRVEAGTDLEPVHGPERQGDVKHSLADISKARKLLGYTGSIPVEEGLKITFDWYKKHPNRIFDK